MFRYIQHPFDVPCASHVWQTNLILGPRGQNFASSAKSLQDAHEMATKKQCTWLGSVGLEIHTKGHFGREVQKFHGWFYLLTGGSLIARYCTIPLSPAPSNPLTDGLQIKLQDGAEYVQMSKAETRADLRAARNSYPCKRGGDAQEDRLAQPGMLEGLTVIRCNFLLRIKLAVHTWRQAWQSCETQTRNHSIAIASCWPPVQTAQRPRESLCCRLHATKPGMVTQCELKTWKSVSVCGTLNGRKWYKVIKWEDISE